MTHLPVILNEQTSFHYRIDYIVEKSTTTSVLFLYDRPDLIHEQLGVLQSQLQEHGYQPNSAHFSIGNAVFVQEGIPVELDFIKHSIAYYSSDVRYVEFRRNSETAKNVINK